MRSPSQKLVAKPLPLSKKRNKCAVSGTIFPGVRYSISNFIKPGTRTGPYRELALTVPGTPLSYFI
jgi:hypothetical protein